MSRTKGDFINYARTSQYGSVSETDDTTDYDGTEDLIISPYGANPSNDEPVTIASSGTGRNLSSSFFDLGIEQRTFAREQIEDRGVYSSDPGDDGIITNPGIRDIPVRNIDTSSHSTVSPISGPTRTVKRKRTSTIDKMLGVVGKSLPRATKAKKAVQATQSAQKTLRKFLTIAESTNYRTGLINIVMWSSDHFDDGLTAITKGHRQVSIWSSLEYADAEILVDAFLEAGQKSEYWANAVRQVVEYSKKAQVATILLPKLYLTIMYLVTTGIDLRIM